MEIIEIMKDALVYPINNVKALVLYLILGVILGIVVALTFAAIFAGISDGNVIEVFGFGIIGGLISIILCFIVSGYQLDIVKYGIERNDNAPGIDIIRQTFNGVKLLVVYLAYFIIPIIISAILGLIFKDWLATILMIVLFIIFAMAAFMAQCRLAKTEDIMDALSIGDALGDITGVGIVNLILFALVVVVVTFILLIIAGFITQLNSTVGGIVEGIIGIYLAFFVSRATGLLYSNV
ncbi:DUF4013 domain-containing protein [uncultured Methanobrevibacter sp.]|uniref:DUF4013 domain-containing protein n=1 Tax=uncultured Methanobrevibacter sp. TaxID=253161 RepID=UPI0025DE2845|nr:DUF4013 domain-containing protein [uncultured Methanobrevibacter sp.]